MDKLKLRTYTCNVQVSSHIRELRSSPSQSHSAACSSPVGLAPRGRRKERKGKERKGKERHKRKRKKHTLATHSNKVCITKHPSDSYCMQLCSDFTHYTLSPT